MDTETQIAFEGTKEEKEIAARTFELMKRKGMLFGANAPIRMSVENIAKALSKDMPGGSAGNLSARIEGALGKNGEVFARGNNGEFITTKSGRAYHSEKSQNTHTFKDRLNTEATSLDAEAAKEYASSLMSRAAERTAFTENLVDIPIMPSMPNLPQPVMQPTVSRNFDIPTLIPQHLIPQPLRVEKEEEPEEAEAPTPQRTRDIAASTATPTAVTPPASQVHPQPRPVEEELPMARRAAPAPITPQPRVAPEPQRARPVEETPATVAPAAAAPAAQPAVETPAPAVVPPKRAAAPAPVAAPQPVAPTGPVEVRFVTDDGPVTVDLLDSPDDILANEAVEAALTLMIERAVEADSRLVRFGSDIFPEEAIERFSKNDFRRVKEYLDEPETGGVASDHDIMADALGRRAEHPDYERMRLSLNYRLLKEKKDFEFVGIDSDRLWINAGASPVVPPVRKPAEIGQDYRYLEDPAIASVEEEEAGDDIPVGPLGYSLTYYEYENGVLPYDRRAKQIFRGHVFEDQRGSMLRFEIPQLYASLVAELRYPTGNRGGFIMGMADLFTGHMVPGARFTIVPTDRGEDVFEIHFTRKEEVEANLLQLDERKGRYVFRPVSYTIETDPAMLLTQEKFGKLHNHKKLEESERKRADLIIANAFDAVGEDNDGKLWAVFDDIFPVVNIERPVSRTWLRTMLSGAYPFFYPDESTEGAYFYDASKRPS